MIRSSLFIQRSCRRQRARTMVVILVVVLVVSAIAAALWHSQSVTQTPSPDKEGQTNAVVLSESTHSVLRNLNSPVDLRFYAVLDPASTSEDLRAFAGRISHLLSAYKESGGGKLEVVEYSVRSESAPAAASADGLRPFNLDKGNACFLGIVIACGAQKELLTQLAPEWEPALEYDLSRAIARAATAPAAARPPATASAAIDRSAIEEVKRMIPNIDAVSLDSGRQMLREAALRDYKSVIAEMEMKLKDAQSRFTEAQRAGAESEKQRALKQIQQVQMEQAEKLKEIADRSQNQIQAFESLKAGTP
jgi:hypothetical protein